MTRRAYCWISYQPMPPSWDGRERCEWSWWYAGERGYGVAESTDTESARSVAERFARAGLDAVDRCAAPPRLRLLGGAP